MNSKNTEIKIDESKHEEVPGVGDRIKTAFLSVLLAMLLVQVYYFWGFFKGYSLGPGSVFFDFGNPIFLGVCGILGWFRGQKFVETLHVEIGRWKFW